jgi:hypothetical protein
MMALRLVPDNAKAAVTVENRCAPRRPASQVPSIAGLRLSPHGAIASLVNISGSGLLAESTIRLKTGSAVTVLFDGNFSPTSIASRVARCEVSGMGADGILRYHVGIAFNGPLALDEAPSARADQPSAFNESDTPPPVSPALPAVARNRW